MTDEDRIPLTEYTCPKCGEVIPVLAKVCSKCGFAIRGLPRIRAVAFLSVEFVALMATAAAIWFLWDANEETRKNLKLQSQEAARSDTVQTELVLLVRELAQVQREFGQIVGRRDSLESLQYVEDKKPWIIISSINSFWINGRVTDSVLFKNIGKSLASHISVTLQRRYKVDSRDIEDSVTHSWQFLEAGRELMSPYITSHFYESISYKITLRWRLTNLDKYFQTVDYMYAESDTTIGKWQVFGMPSTMRGKLWKE